MKGESLKRKMIDNKDVWYFIFEEMSLIDRMLFACTDLRSRDIFESNEVFAQRNVIILGDFAQLQSINDKCIYEKPSIKLKNELAHHGYKL